MLEFCCGSFFFNNSSRYYSCIRSFRLELALLLFWPSCMSYGWLILNCADICSVYKFGWQSLCKR